MNRRWVKRVKEVLLELCEVLRANPRWRMAGGSLADDGCSQELATWVEHALLDDPVRPLQQCLRDCQAECLRRLEIDDQFELRGLLDGEVGWFGTLEDLVHVGDGAKF